VVRLIKVHPVFAYFALTFLSSWSGALAVAAPHLLRHQTLPKITGILMFPVMLVGPSLAGAVLTRIVDGPAGLRFLLTRTLRWKVSPVWYAALLIPPVLVLSVLLFLETTVSPVYAHPVWNSRWFSGRNRLDGLRLPENAFAKRCARARYLARLVVEPLAPSGYRLPRHRLSTRRLFVSLLPRVYPSHDRDAGVDWLDLYEHSERVVGAAHACKLDQLVGRVQPSTSDPRTGSDVVRPLRNHPLGFGRNRC
jgi:hypothetical protein